MTIETVLAVTGVWITVGFIVFRWAADFSREESERELSESELALKENARQQARLAQELEAARAELGLLQSERSNLPDRRPGSAGCAPSSPCMEQ